MASEEDAKPAARTAGEVMAEEEAAQDDFVWQSRPFMPVHVPEPMEEEVSSGEGYLTNKDENGLFCDYGNNRFYEAREPSGWNLQVNHTEFNWIKNIQSEETYLLDIG